MLSRQKTLLHLIACSGGAIDRLVLTKLAFLLRHETDSRGGNSFYDFVPYQYGPFSFSLYQEADKLVAQGYLRESGTTGWSLGQIDPPPLSELNIQRDVKRVMSRYSSLTTDDLLDTVYKKYPRFTINSKRKRLAQRTIADLAVYTAGYEGKSVDAFLNGLVESGIQHLIDVRMNPIARRYGFHRSTLSRLCERLGICYSHVPALGIPSSLRQCLETMDDYNALFEKYERTTLRKELDAIETVSNWVNESPSVIVCMEAEPACCHRARLALPVSAKTGRPIIHLK